MPANGDVMHGAAQRADIVVVAVIGSSVDVSVRARVVPLREMAGVNELASRAIANVSDGCLVVQCE